LRRGIELPEEVLRAQRRSSQQRFAAAGAFGLVGFALVVATCVLVVRRRPVLIADTLRRATALVILAILAVFELGGALQSLPGTLLQYDTAVPWDRFLSETALGFGLSLVGVFVLASLWLLVHALRRRVGIPIPTSPVGAPPLRDVVLAGIGLASTLVVVQQASAIFLRGPIAAAPSTSLDQAVPELAHALSAVSGPGMLVPVVAIPILGVVGAARNRVQFVALAACLLVCMLGVVWSAADLAGVHGAQGIALSGAVFLAVVAALRTWGAVSVVSWIVAGLVLHAADALRLIVYAPTLLERFGGAISVTVIAVLLAVTVTWTKRATTSPSAEVLSG
jgi:hypothetical protein